jgi:hypothetical protein
VVTERIMTETLQTDYCAFSQRKPVDFRLFAGFKRQIRQSRDNKSTGNLKNLFFGLNSLNL